VRANWSPYVVVTETELYVSNTLPTLRDNGLPEVAAAIADWLAFHNIDVMDVRLCGEPVVRDPERRQVRYPAMADSGQFFTAVEQGEAPPLPWPSILDRWRVGRP